MSEISVVVGANVRALRKKAGWTQETLAEKVDVSVPFLASVESGKKTPSLDLVERLARAFSVRFDALFFTPDSVFDRHGHKMLYLFERDLIKNVVAAIHETIEG